MGEISRVGDQNLGSLLRDGEERHWTGTDGISAMCLASLP